MHTVIANGEMSETSVVKTGVPQGSILIPILFLLYKADAACIVQFPEINFLSHASDLELFLYSKTDEICLTLPHVASCIDAIYRLVVIKSSKINRLQLIIVRCDSMHR